MGITIDQQNKLVTKAETKKDGCYRYDGFAYRVRDCGVTHIGGKGEILACYGSFNVFVSRYDWHTDHDKVAQDILRKI